MSVMSQERAQVETWRNMTAGKVVLKRMDARGQLMDEIIAGHKTFTLTPDERRINSDKAANDELDPFKNGMLTPVRLIEGDEDVESIRTNPNLLADSELRGLFKSKGPVFADKIGGVSNPITLNRLLELAYEHDATIGQVEAIRARLDAVAPQIMDVTAGAAGEVRTTAPQGRKRQNKGSDGMGTDGSFRAVTPG